MDEEPSLNKVNDLLETAFRSLGEAAPIIRDLDFNKHENVKRIADALSKLVDIQLEIYRKRPDLKPRDLQDIDLPADE